MNDELKELAALALRNAFWHDFSALVNKYLKAAAKPSRWNDGVECIFEEIDMRDKRTWALENHICKGCGGRILRCVTGSGMTGGGNPVFKCADCGKEAAAMGPEILCWCGFSHRGNRDTPYTCQPFVVLKDRPELLSAFRACGCDPERGEVGIMLERDLRSNTEVSGRPHQETEKE